MLQGVPVPPEPQEAETGGSLGLAGFQASSIIKEITTLPQGNEEECDRAGYASLASACAYRHTCTGIHYAHSHTQNK